MNAARIGIVSALEPEIRTLRKAPADFAVAVCGMGAAAAYGTAKRLVDGGATALVSWGCAAALDLTLAAGTLLVPDAVVASDGRTHPVDAEWQRELIGALGACRVAPLAEANQLIATRAAKRALAARTGAAAADMESAGVARAAAECGVPFLAVRAVADAADVAVPPQLARTVAPDGSLELASGVARLLISPWHWPAAVRLGVGFNRALLALRTAAPALYACEPGARPAASAAMRPSVEERDAACVFRA